MIVGGFYANTALCAVFLFLWGERGPLHALAGLHVLNNIPGLEKRGESQAGGRRSSTLKGDEFFPREIRNVAKSLYYQGFPGFFTGAKTLFFGQGLAG